MYCDDGAANSKFDKNSAPCSWGGSGEFVSVKATMSDRVGMHSCRDDELNFSFSNAARHPAGSRQIDAFQLVCLPVNARPPDHRSFSELA